MGTRRIDGLVWCYGLAPAFVSIALILSEPLHQLVPGISSYIFLAAVIASAWLGGGGPGLLAVALASLAFDFFFLPPLYTLGISSQARAYLLPFILSSLAAAWMGAMRRKAAETRDQCARLAIAVEQAAQSVMITDPSGRIKYVNRAFTAMTGYSLEEIQGRNPRLLKSCRQAPEFYADLWHTIGSGQIWRGQLVNRQKDGSLYTEEMTIAPVRDARGNVREFIALKQDVSERIRREEAQAFLAAIVEHSADAILSCWPDGTIRSWNRGAEKLLGYASGEMVGQSGFTIAPPERGEFLDAALQRIIGGEVLSEHEGVCLHKDGRRVPVSVIAFPVRNSREDVAAIVINLRDIAERKRALDAIRESEERFRSIADNCPAIMWMTGPQGEIEFVNRAFREFGGRSLIDVQNGQWASALHPEDGRYLEEFRTSVRDRLRFHSEARIRRKDGQWRLVGSHAEPRFSSGGEYLGHIGLSSDITDRHRAEQSLKQSEEKFRQLADNVREVFWIMSADAEQMIYVSPAYESIWGRSCASLYLEPMQWASSIVEVDRPSALSLFDRQMHGEDIVSDYRICTPAGELKWIRDRAYPVRDSAGAIVRVVGIAEDITGPKKQAEDLENAVLLLKKEIERSNELADEAARANRAKSDFLATMSHEIRTPMNGVAGMTDLLLATELTSEQRHYAASARQSCDSLLTLIDDILDFSRIEAGRIQIESADFHLQELLEGVMTMLAPQAYAKGLELCCIVDPRIPAHLCGDAGRVRQIFLNLCGNALKFTECGEIAVRVSIETQNENGSLLRCSVRDTGIGIAKEKLPLLFQRFSQLDSSASRRFPGSGLGLAISKKLAITMGGDIGVVTEPGSGSEFWFTLWLAPATTSPVQSTDLSCPHLSGSRALIVDHHPMCRELLVTRFSGWGVRTTEAASVSEALQALYRSIEESQPFQFAIVDARILAANGIALHDALCADPRFKDLSLLIMAPPGGAHRALLARPAARPVLRINKPLGPAELRNALCTARCGANCLSHRTADARTPQRLPRPTAGTSGAPLSGSVLLAEDNPINQQVALGILGKLGIRADVVTDGAAAIRALQERSYDLVLMDVRMPLMDGVEATRSIRDPHSLVMNRDVPIVALTANALKGEKERCLAAGMNGFLSKPFTPGAMRSELNRWLAAGEHVEQPVPSLESCLADDPGLCFDREGVLERLMGDKELAQTVVRAFIEDFPRQLQDLKNALQSLDQAAIARCAHSIKGAAANVGAEQLRAKASQMENCADAGRRLESIDADALNQQFIRFLQAVRQEWHGI